MKRAQTSRTFGDECALYEVTDYKAATIGEFIQEALKHYPREWGYFDVDLELERCEYRYGKLLSDFSDRIKKMEIAKVSGYGGWSRFDYDIRPLP